jgi:hypothetical protein
MAACSKRSRNRAHAPDRAEARSLAPVTEIIGAFPVSVRPARSPISLTGVTLPISDVAARSHDALADDRAFLRVRAALVIAIDVFVPAATGGIEALPQWADSGPAVVFSRATEFLRGCKVRPGQPSRYRCRDKKELPHSRTSICSQPGWSGKHITNAGAFVTLAEDRWIGEVGRIQPRRSEIRRFRLRHRVLF